MNRLTSLVLAAAVAVSCAKNPQKGSDDGVGAVPASAIPGHESLQDNSPKEGPRLLHAEVYLRSYGRLFGDFTPAQVEEIGRGETPGALFDRWGDYLASLGLPDYRADVNRGAATNSIMVATFDRLAIALCVRAVERELRGAIPVPNRRVFPFDNPDRALTDAEFDERFDRMHKTFLGYPVKLAETDRLNRFRTLYRTAISDAEGNSLPRRLTAREIGWAAVCYGVARHPEFHLY